MNKIREAIEKQKEQTKNTIDSSVKLEEYQQFVCFLLGEEEFGVPILDVQEIIKPTHYTRVPNTNDEVIGVFNLRGSIIPLIDFNIKLKSGKQTKIESKNRIIVLKNNNLVIGVVVDTLSEAKNIPLKDIVTNPNNNSENTFVQKVANFNDKIITILDAEKMINNK